MRYTSVLCVPGHRDDFLEKCRSYGASTILFDLEDGVPHDQREKALNNARKFLTSEDCVRVHAKTTEYYEEDLDVSTKAGVTFLSSCEGDPRIRDRRVVPIIETPRGLSNLGFILCHRCVDAVAIGLADINRAFGIDHQSPSLSAHVKYQVSLAAKVRGIECIDTPCFTRDDAELFRQIQEDKELGIACKGCVYPEHITACSVLSARKVAPTSEGIVRLGNAQIGPPMRTYDIRPASINDVREVVDLVMEYLEEIRSVGSDIVPSKRTRDFVSWLVEGVIRGTVNGAVVWAPGAGFSMASANTEELPYDSDLDPIAHSWGTYVRPGDRGRQLADKLRLSLFSLLRERGFKSVLGAIHNANENSKKSQTSFKPISVNGIHLL